MGCHGLLQAVWSKMYGQVKHLGEHTLDAALRRMSAEEGSFDAGGLLLLSDSELHTQRLGARGAKSNEFLSASSTLRDLTICVVCCAPVERLLWHFLKDMSEKRHLSHEAWRLPLVQLCTFSMSPATLAMHEYCQVLLHSHDRALPTKLPLFDLLDGADVVLALFVVICCCCRCFCLACLSRPAR